MVLLDNMGAKSRRKGAVGERELSKELSRLFNVDARRGRQFKGTPDSPDVVGLEGIHIECKRDESTLGKLLYRAIEQAKEDSGESVPIVIGRRNRENWVVAVELDDLPELVRILWKHLQKADS